MQALAIKKSRHENKQSNEPGLDPGALFQAYYPRIYTYLRYRVNSAHDAEDLISIVFERAYTHRDQFDANRGAFSTWLFRIAHNALANYYRTHERRSGWEAGIEPPVDLVASEPSPEVQIVEKETIVQLLQGLEALSERDQEVISLKFAGRLGNKEIGEIMDMKEKTVSVALLRALRRLRQHLGEVDYE